MPEPCHYCGKPVRTSKDNHRTTTIKVNGEWTTLTWHTKCDPFKVSVVVTRKAGL
jgi:hypothetical protein